MRLFVSKKLKMMVWIFLIVCSMGSSAFAWSESGHRTITEAALSYINSQDSPVRLRWAGFLSDADRSGDPSESEAEFEFLTSKWADSEKGKLFASGLDNRGYGQYFPGPNNILGETQNYTSVTHTSPRIHARLYDNDNDRDNYQIHNAVQCALFARYEREHKNYNEARTILAIGLHFLQDYFAHLRCSVPVAPGVEQKHGIPLSIQYDGRSVGYLVDDIHYDNHDVDGSKMNTSDLYVEELWHYHEDANDSWRYMASKYMTAAYIEAFFLDDRDLSGFIDDLNSGLIHNYDNTYTRIDNQTHLVLDNQRNPDVPDAAFGTTKPGGTWRTSASRSGYYGPNYLYSNDAPDDAYFMWTPPNIPDTLKAGKYRIYMRWASSPGRTDNAEITITHAKGTKTVYKNQQQAGGVWNLLGTYELSNSSHGTVTIYNNDYGNTIADAVMYVSVE